MNRRNYGQSFHIQELLNQCIVYEVLHFLMTSFSEGSLKGMARRLLEIAAAIVTAQASVGKISPEEIEQTLMSTFLVLQRMQIAEQENIPLDAAEEGGFTARVEKHPEALDPKESIRDNKIACLECGVEMKQLTKKHLGSHGLTPRDYKVKYGFPMKQSLSAKSLSRARSRAAKKRGLPENLVKFQEARKRKKAADRKVPSTT
jgi:predicted transcriptional regulator